MKTKKIFKKKNEHEEKMRKFSGQEERLGKMIKNKD